MPKYFHFHSPTNTFNAPLKSHQCGFIKANQERCKRRVVIGLPMCPVHVVATYKLAIDDSELEHAGKGLFAFDKTKTVDEVIFTPNQVICPYGGEEVDNDEMQRRYGDYTAPYGLQLGESDEYEDAALQRGIGSLINHYPRKQNCKLDLSDDNKGQIVATEFIQNGQELYTSYGTQYKMRERGVSSGTNTWKYNL